MKDVEKEIEKFFFRYIRHKFYIKLHNSPTAHTAEQYTFRLV